jgi:hypothetical protein
MFAMHLTVQAEFRGSFQNGIELWSFSRSQILQREPSRPYNVCVKVGTDSRPAQPKLRCLKSDKMSAFAADAASARQRSLPSQIARWLSSRSSLTCQASEGWRPHRDSNPGFSLERATMAMT